MVRATTQRERIPSTSIDDNVRVHPIVSDVGISPRFPPTKLSCAIVMGTVRSGSRQKERHSISVYSGGVVRKCSVSEGRFDLSNAWRNDVQATGATLNLNGGYDG